MFVCTDWISAPVIEIFFSHNKVIKMIIKKNACQKNKFFFQFKKILTFLSKLTCGINQNNEIHKINEFIKNNELEKKFSKE
jgi:hypothetical protein